MRPLLLNGMLLLAGAGGHAAEVISAAPEAVSVTVYRAPARSAALNLDDLQGFALITETRRVTLPAGVSTLRFAGVAGGIQAETALITGFPEGVLEKNRDARLLSPTALLAASLHRAVELERTDPKTGRITRTRGILESDTEGVIFTSAEGVEALRCSGLPETFGFEPFAGADAVPTLSVRVHSAVPVTRTLTLSYLAGGFDWSATYTATLSADRTTLDLGAWVTLANGNGESFPAAQTQVVAGRLNREASAAAPADAGGPILAQCWPQGSTRDGTPLPVAALADAAPRMLMRSLALPAPALRQEVSMSAARRVSEEPLGDLKLYRVPERTTLAARQMKQVRLLDQSGVPVHEVFRVQVASAGGTQAEVSRVIHQLRTRNSRPNHLGLPLPAGRIAVYVAQDGHPLLLSDGPLKDHAIDEELSLNLGEAPDLVVTADTAARDIDPGAAGVVPLLPGLSLRSVAVQTLRRIEISSALSRTADVEVALGLPAGEQVVGADQPLQHEDGRPTFRVRVPANGRVALRYATARTADLLIRAR